MEEKCIQLKSTDTLRLLGYPQSCDEGQNAELRLILMEASIMTFGPRKVTFGVTVGIGNMFVWGRICSLFYQTAFSIYQSLVRWHINLQGVSFDHQKIVLPSSGHK